MLKLVDGVDLPGEMVEADAAASLGRLRADAEQAEVVMVTRARQPQEHGLTPAGRAKIDEAAAVHARDLEEVFAAFTPQERGVLDRLLDRLRPAA